MRKYGTPAEIKKPRGSDLHRMDPIINPSRKRKKKNRRSGGIDDTAALEAEVEKLQKTRNLCFTAISNLETKLTREMKNIDVQQAQFEVGCRLKLLLTEGLVLVIFRGCMERQINVIGIGSAGRHRH